MVEWQGAKNRKDYAELRGGGGKCNFDFELF